MKRAALIIAALIFAMLFIGCRDITSDLHDIYTVTINLKPELVYKMLPDDPWNESYYQGGSVNGKMFLTLRTDVRGRISKLPEAKWGKWDFDCPGYTLYGDEDIEEDRWYHMSQEQCEDLGCDKFKWTFIPEPNGHEFLGWYTSGGSLVTEWTVFKTDTMLFPRWFKDDGAAPPAGSVAAQINDLKTGLGLPNRVTINVDNDQTLLPQDLTFGGVDIEITLKGKKPIVKDFFGIDYERDWYTVLYLGKPGALFTVGKGVTFIIDDVEMWGFHRNNSSTIVVDDGGTLILRGNTSLWFNNVFSDRHGGAITVNTGGKLIMEDGLIKRNTSRHPTITGRYVIAASGGGGVWVRGGDFIMNGGLFHENMAWGCGAAVKLSHGGTFTMNRNHRTVVDSQGRILEDYDPKMWENQSWFAGGVWVSGGEGLDRSESVFTMNAGTIEDNFAVFWGGAVLVFDLGRFVMDGGILIDNEADIGGGIMNFSGKVQILTGEIIGNSALGGFGGGIANFHYTEMWGGQDTFIAVNEAGFGGGIANLFDADFLMFDGFVMVNIGNGGPAGGVLNFGQFEMHGGLVIGNYSNSSSGGGIFHGSSNYPEDGLFVITGGQIWNNRDLTTYHYTPSPGLPGNQGNIRRNTPFRSMVVARPGFFSMNQADRPAGWSMEAGLAPVFTGTQSNLLDPDFRPTPTTVTMPTGWQTIYWFFPPVIPGQANYYKPSDDRQYPYFTIGRPRIERWTVDNPNDYQSLMLDVSASVVSESGADIDALRGGTWWPMTLETAHVDNGYIWMISRGHLILGTSSDTVAEWPWPSFRYYNQVTATPSQAWPWVANTYPTPLLPPSPMMSAPSSLEMQMEAIEEHPAFERLKHKYPHIIERAQHKTGQISEWPVRPIETMMEHMEKMIAQPRLEDRFGRVAERIMENQGDGNGNGGGGVIPHSR